MRILDIDFSSIYCFAGILNHTMSSAEVLMKIFEDLIQFDILFGSKSLNEV